MKKTKLIVGLLVAAGCLSVYAASKKDPVLMKVDGKPVTLSEFEYMYHKNNQQQVSKLPLDKYVDMFTTYKLKVADAEAAGIDTTKSFIREYEGYRGELAGPYLRDTVAEENLMKELYERMKYSVKSSHIMLPLGRNAKENKVIKRQMDSIRTCILNGESFEALAEKHSVDRSVQNNKGSMGFVTVGRFPSQFEAACFETPEGEISEPFMTDFGWHIVKTFERRPNDGKVLVEHILRLYPMNATEAQKEKVAQYADSLYNLVKGGADFEELARRESEDPGSARNGGRLPLFGRGEMVPEFEEVSYALGKGEISEPFATRYGVHFVKKLDTKPIGSYAEMRDQVRGLLQRDEKGNIAFTSRVDQLKKQYRLMRNVELENRLKAEVTSPDSLDADFIAKYEDSNETLFQLAGKSYPLSLLIDNIKGNGRMADEVAHGFLDSKIEALETSTVVEYEKQMLEKNNPDFKNLVNEYRDGMLLFEISNRNVWEKASTDTEGLQSYFEKNRSKYRWDSPKYKGYLVQTTGDSITRLVKSKIATMAQDTVVTGLRKAFGKDIKVTKVLVSKGENKKVDSEVFGGAKVEPTDKFTDYFVFGGKLVAKPEDVSDVRGQVVSDYQNYLEEKWVEQLRKKYKVEVDKKVLNMVE